MYERLKYAVDVSLFVMENNTPIQTKMAAANELRQALMACIMESDDRNEEILCILLAQTNRLIRLAEQAGYEELHHQAQALATIREEMNRRAS